MAGNMVNGILTNTPLVCYENILIAIMSRLEALVAHENILQPMGIR